jgi:2'-5' RNA ligase
MTDTVRLFFAAWPAASVQERLHALAQNARSECGGRAVAQRNIHLTLAFLGDVPRERLPQIEAVAGGIDGACCELAVDRLQYWRHNRIVWAGVERCPEPLRDLARALSARLRAIGFRLDDRPYVPHVTLLRDARRAPADLMIPAIAWPVADIALVESVQRDNGRAYEILQRWPLGE